MRTNIGMEILESILWVALGFLPTLAFLEVYDRLRRGRRKEILLAKVPTIIKV
jgi:hypothetical protein